MLSIFRGSFMKTQWFFEVLKYAKLEIDGY